MKKYLLLLVLILLISSCKNENNSENQSEKFYFSKENNCAEQAENFKNNGKTSLYFFDLKGIMDEATYENSPSNILLNELRTDSTFINYASKTFDFFVFDLNCDVGEIKSQNFDVFNFPTILLVDENEKVIFKRVGITSSQNLILDIKNILNKE